MPYIWTEPEEAITYRGVSVYHVYKDGWRDCGRREFLYTTDITENSGQFDIRDLTGYQEGEDHAVILRKAVENGELTAPADESE
jgi:hypothetical protein